MQKEMREEPHSVLLLPRAATWFLQSSFCFPALQSSLKVNRRHVMQSPPLATPSFRTFVVAVATHSECNRAQPMGSGGRQRGSQSASRGLSFKLSSGRQSISGLGAGEVGRWLCSLEEEEEGLARSLSRGFRHGSAHHQGRDRRGLSRQGGAAGYTLK